MKLVFVRENLDPEGVARQTPAWDADLRPEPRNPGMVHQTHGRTLLHGVRVPI